MNEKAEENGKGQICIMINPAFSVVFCLFLFPLFVEPPTPTPT
jgi:hypothetical protein